MSDNFRDWIYSTVSGSNPGSVGNSSSSVNNNNQNNSPTIVISDLLPLNLVLALIAVAIVLFKKKK